MSPAELQAIRHRLAAANVGGLPNTPVAVRPGGNDGVVRSAEGWTLASTSGHEARAEFYAHAPVDVAALLAEVERLTRKLQHEHDSAVDPTLADRWRRDSRMLSRMLDAGVYVLGAGMLSNRDDVDIALPQEDAQ